MAKPTTTKINWNNPIAKGLIWNVLPGTNSNIDYVSGTRGTLLTSGVWNGSNKLGTAFGSSSTTNGGAYWPFTNILTTITTKFSIVVFAKIDTVTAFSHLFCIPYSNTWSSPFSAIHWFRNNTANNMVVSWTNGGNFDGVVSSATDYPTDGIVHMLGISCNTDSGRSVRFFKDGVLSGTGTTVTGGATDFGNKREVILFNHNSADNGEGVIGTMGFAALWNRQISDNEMKSIYTNPYQLYTQPMQSQLNTGIFR